MESQTLIAKLPLSKKNEAETSQFLTSGYITMLDKAKKVRYIETNTLSNETEQRAQK